MKRCPKCGARFTEDNSFCLDDGTLLVDQPEPAETVILPTRPTNGPSGPQPEPKSALIYIILGAMAATIAALALAMYFTRDPAGTGVSNANVANLVKASSPPVSNSRPAPDPPPERVEPPITETAARDVLNDWVRSQNGRKAADYAALYAPAFVGYKVTPDGEKDRMNRNQWLADRRRMMPNFIEVQAQNESVRIDGETAVVKFTQRWRSTRHCDVGEKELTIQMINGRPMIRSEVIRNPYPC